MFNEDYIVPKQKEEKIKKQANNLPEGLLSIGKANFTGEFGNYPQEERKEDDFAARLRAISRGQ